MKVKVKTFSELVKICSQIDYISEEKKELKAFFPCTWEGKSGKCPGFVVSMSKYCDDVIMLDDWDGWKGYDYLGYAWTLPMIVTDGKGNPLYQDEHNRNGANK